MERSDGALVGMITPPGCVVSHFRAAIAASLLSSPIWALEFNNWSVTKAVSPTTTRRVGGLALASGVGAGVGAAAPGVAEAAGAVFSTLAMIVKGPFLSFVGSIDVALGSVT